MPAPVACLDSAFSAEGNSPPPETTRHVGLFFAPALSKEQEMVRNIMKRLPVHLFSCVVAAVLIALLLTAEVAEAAAWTVVPSPSPGVAGNVLPAVASVSATDVWAVGEATDATGRQLTLTEHWNGTAWSVVTAPKHVGVLDGITAISTNDVWAVGQFSNASGVFQTLIEHWNGHTWRVVSSPNASTHNNFLNGVTAASASDIWAVGDFLPAATVPEQTLTLHWNGHTWSVVSSPNVG